jgi:hypothetical protein
MDNIKECKKYQCPFHACMSDNCQIKYILENAPHIVKEYKNNIQAYCPNWNEVKKYH